MLFMKKINVPENEIEAITDRIYEKGVNEMFTFVEEWDVTKSREELRKALEQNKKVLEQNKKALEQNKKEREKGRNEGKKIIQALKKGKTPEDIAKAMALPLAVILEWKTILEQIA